MHLRHVLTVCAAAVMCATAASAANVQLYGLIDTGLNFKSVDADNGKGRQESLLMAASQLAPNRWGMRGTEDLGEGWKMGLTLEGQFASDTGAMQGGRLFHRTAQIAVISDTYGTLSFGRSGALRSGFGTTGIWGAKTHPFSNAAGSYVGHKYLMPGGFKAIDNTITYQSPVWAGARLHLQYAMDNDAVNNAGGVENKDSANRQWAVGLTYANGPLNAVAVFDSTMYKSQPNGTVPERSLAFSAEADYDFQLAKIYVSGMWFDDMKASEFQGHDFNGQKMLTSRTTSDAATLKGYALQLGADIAAAGGKVKVNVGWMDAKASDNGTLETDRISFGLGYVYPLSKRTQLYTVGAYLRDGYQKRNSKEVNPDAYELIAGLMHRF